MTEFSFSVPQNIMVGPGTMDKVSELALKLNAGHALIISGPNLLKMGVVGRVSGALKSAGIECSVFTDVEANPSVATVEKAAEFFESEGADMLIALGGGSPMDVAKAVGVVVKYGGSITQYEGAGKVPGPIIPLIAIPTTAGSGSEVTAFSVITDHARNYKLTVFSYELLPAYALLDPELLTTAPASVAAACGIDAFIHAFESYISRMASPFSEAMSEKAMELIGGSIRRFVANRGDLEAAQNMLVGSLFAGIAFSFARLGNVHAMSHPISAYYGVAHGVANAVLLPVVVAYNSLADHGKYAKVYNYISPVKVYDYDFRPDMLEGAIRKLCADIGIPDSLYSAISAADKTKTVSREDVIKNIPALSEDAMKSGNILSNPRSTLKGDIEKLYEMAL